MHAMCSVDRQSPLEEYLRTIYPSRMTAHPTTYCFFCYETEAAMVRYALIGRAVKLAIDTAQVAWRKKYEPILDAWPRTPKCDESPIGTVLDTIQPQWRPRPLICWPGSGGHADETDLWMVVQRGSRPASR